MQKLLHLLSEFESPHVFNPWRSGEPMDALADGAANRRERLANHFACAPSLILVGEAPGYQGCRFSGIPFTNEKLILEGRIPRVSSVFRLTTRARPWCEPSATIVWGLLHELGIAAKVVLWNSFAWHPHRPDIPHSNRPPTTAELQAGLHVLKSVTQHFAGVPIVPVGQVASRTLKSLGIRTLDAIRHPAMGGATEFRSGLAELMRRGIA